MFFLFPTRRKYNLTQKLLDKLAEEHSTWWNASWFVFLLMGRPAGNYGALTMGSGKEVLDAKRATTENELGTYRAGSGFSKLKTAGVSTGREARRARQQADRHITRVRNAAILKGQDPDAVEEAYLASIGKGRAPDTTSKRLDIHHHKPTKEQTSQGKRCLSLSTKREQLQDSAMEDCGIDSEYPSIVELKKKRFLPIIRCVKPTKSWMTWPRQMLLTELMKTNPRPDQYPALVVDSECPRVLLRR